MGGRRRGRERLGRAQPEAPLAHARQLLIDAGRLRLALGQQPALFQESGYPLPYGEWAVANPKRNGYSCSALSGQMTTDGGLVAQDSAHPSFMAIERQLPGRLGQQIERLAGQRKLLLPPLAVLGSTR